jgi:CxxC motif-containing protein (DUF1111 family)
MTRGAAAGLLLALLASPAGADDAYDEGKALFERKWESAADGGLGPLFNAKSCNGCHKDGGPSRVFKVDGEWIARGAVVRIGGRVGTPDSLYGRQLQDLAIAGLTPEAAIDFDFDGQPAGKIDYKTGAPDPASATEIRLAPSLLGRRMLEAVSADAILAREDPTDRNGDGISGRARKLFGGAIGRFGHKANTPTIIRQSAEAAAIDLGLATTLVAAPQGDCTALQPDCLLHAKTNAIELDDDSLALIANFVASLAAPTPPIAPLIDLDPRDSLRRYLHDGRARTITEAITLHSGEASFAAARFQALSPDARVKLAVYLAGL